MTIPVDFAQQMEAQLGAEWPAFQAALDSPVPVSIRLNPVKPIHPPVSAEAIPWHHDAYYLPERPIFTLDPFFHAGCYYVQEASSMFITEAFRQCFPERRPLRVLDLCAAPGGKTTLLASLLPPQSLLLANEVIKNRYPILRQNVIKWGQAEVHTSQHDPADFAGLEGWFDLVLVDAPCSGEGLFRKDPQAMSEWSKSNVQLCHRRQQRILQAAAPLVRPGGVLIYSTCTYNTAENRDNVQSLTQDDAFTLTPLSIPEDWGIVDTGWGYQFYPHRLRGEGFFLACLRKESSGSASFSKKTKPANLGQRVPRKQKEQLQAWIRADLPLQYFQNDRGNIMAVLEHQLEDLATLTTVLPRLHWGTPLGEFKRQDFVPRHELALSVLLSPQIERLALDRTTALQYLKRENIQWATARSGWQLASYEGHALGWLKVLPRRINNYLPKMWRIRMDIPSH